MNLLPTIVAKSDQLNADDLVGGPRTVTITAVKGSDSAEQPVAIHYEGDDGKPFKPCKTCRRVLVHCWGGEGSDYVGRRMTLYCDPQVLFGGIKVGGIRISHVSHIERETTVALMATRGKRAQYTVKPLRAEVRAGPSRQNTSTPSLTDRADAFLARVLAANTTVKIEALWAASAALRDDLGSEDADLLTEVTSRFESKRASLSGSDIERAGEEGDFSGDQPSPTAAKRDTASPQTQGPTLEDRALAYEARLKSATNEDKLKAFAAAARQLHADLERSDPERLVELNDLYDTRALERADAAKAAGQ
jgi:hypothetical protein